MQDRTKPTPINRIVSSVSDTSFPGLTEPIPQGPEHQEPSIIEAKTSGQGWHLTSGIELLQKGGAIALEFDGTDTGDV